MLINRFLPLVPKQTVEVWGHMRNMHSLCYILSVSHIISALPYLTVHAHDKQLRPNDGYFELVRLSNYFERHHICVQWSWKGVCVCVYTVVLCVCTVVSCFFLVCGFMREHDMLVFDHNKLSPLPTWMSNEPGILKTGSFHSQFYKSL